MKFKSALLILKLNHKVPIPRSLMRFTFLSKQKSKNAKPINMLIRKSFRRLTCKNANLIPNI